MGLGGRKFAFFLGFSLFFPVFLSFSLFFWVFLYLSGFFGLSVLFGSFCSLCFLAILGVDMASFLASFVAPDLLEIVFLSLRVSGAALVLGCVFGFPLGAALAAAPWRGQGVLRLLVAVAMGLPPVVVGLFLYLLLNRAGPLGWMALLYTPSAMIVAQVILATPIIAGFSGEVFVRVAADHRDLFRSLGLTRWQVVLTLLYESRLGLVAAATAGFGRAISEVGAVLVVGGNIAHATRIMTTAIALETSRGDLNRAVILGVILLVLALLVNLFFLWLRMRLDDTPRVGKRLGKRAGFFS